MRAGLSSVRFALVLVFALSPWLSLRAQQPTSLAPVEMKDQWLRGSIAVAQHENDGMIGINGKGTDAGYKIETVLPGGPAANAGILPGDVILSVDGTSVKGVGASEALKSIAGKKEGETVNLAFVRNGATKTTSVTVALRKTLQGYEAWWQQESKLAPAVGQFIFGGSATVTANLGQTEQFPSDVFLNVSIASKEAMAFAVDDAKFFVLDGTGQQLRHVSLDEIKYEIQLSVAQNWKGRNFPQPPPPPLQRQYTISGVDNGDYTITNLGGGIGSISGTSSSTYTVTQQPDYNQLGYSLGLAIRQYRDAKSDNRLLEQARTAIASWEGPYFKSQSPVVPGENRSGEILYWTGSNRRPQPPYRVILFFTDPRTQKEEHVTFAFGTGAERIKEEMANQGVGTSTQTKSQVSLSDGDVVDMVEAGLSAEVIVAKIKTASCSFETSPTALKELKDAGVPDSVILAMVQAPRN
ncbi:MAG TPA: PDZ domain-containing protein [Candidatus Acidoferrales bacterium]|nr:PDZ domain-containing protein [Candidatus Acidoferrales bacterium]